MNFEERDFESDGLELHESIQQHGRVLMDGERVYYYDCRPWATIMAMFERTVRNHPRVYHPEVYFWNGRDWIAVQSIGSIRVDPFQPVQLRYYPRPGDNDVSFNF